MDSAVISETIVAGAAPAATTIPTSDIQRVSLLGLRFHCLSLHQTLAVIDQLIAAGTPRQLCLCNAYTLALSRKDKRFKEVLNGADLLLADGMSIVWGARWVSVRLPSRVAGPDLMEAICARAPARHYRIFLLGTSDANLENLAAMLKRRSSDLTIAGTYSPPMCEQMSAAETDKIVTLIQNARPHILFVGMSAPKQEKWIAENLHRLQVPVCLGVGAAFDFLSGRIPRAPVWMQKLGLEWLHRLACEPRRLWRRYVLGNVIFLSLLVKELFLYKLSRLRTALRF